MMLFDPLVASTLLVLVNAGGAPACEIPQPTKIDIRPRSKEIRLDTSKTLDDIQKYEMDTVNPHSFGGTTYTQGFTRGAVEVLPTVELGFQEINTNGDTCIWYNKISVDIVLDPEIILAKEVNADQCMRKAVKDHEMKHVQVDRIVLNNYAQKLGGAIYEALEGRGYIVGPVPASQLESIRQRMEGTIFQIVNNETKRMEVDRLEAQQAIDTIEEYERVAAQCPNFVKRFH